MNKPVKIHTAGPNEKQAEFRRELEELYEKAEGDHLILMYAHPTAAYMGRRTNSVTDTVVKLENVCSVLTARVPQGGALVGTGKPQMGRALVIEPPAGGELGMVEKMTFPTSMPIAELQNLSPRDQHRLLESYLDLIVGSERNRETALGPDPEEDDGEPSPVEA